MAAYMIANVDVKDPTSYDEYRQQVPGTLEKYNGKFLVRGGKVEVLEGDVQPHRVVILEFADAEAAKRWYNSPEYQAIIGIRFKATVSQFIMVEGV